MSANYSRVKVWDSGEVLTASDLNAEHNNHITNGVPAQLGDYSSDATQSNLTADPGAFGSETLPTNLAEELTQMRYVVARIIGGSNSSHRDIPAIDLEQLSTAEDSAIMALEFEGHLGGASSTTDVLAKFINLGGIINAASLSSADVVAADFGTTNVKFGTYSYSLASGNIMAFKPQGANPVKGSATAWFRNLTAGDYILYNPLLGIEVFTESGAGKLETRVTEKTASGDSAKNFTQVQGSATRSAVTEFHNVTAKWRLNDEGGAGTDLIEMEYDGTDEGTQVSSDNIDISTEVDGGVWFIGAKRNDPTWDHTYAANGLPSAHTSAWTYSGTATEGTVTSVSNGVLTIDATAGGATDTAYYERADNIDLSDNSFEFKARVTADGIVDGGEAGCTFEVRDDSMDRSFRMNMFTSMVVFEHRGSSGFKQVYIQYGDFTKFHVFRVTSSGSPSPTTNLYIDGQLVHSDTNDETDSTASDVIQFGNLDATSGSNTTSEWEVIQYGGTALGPVAAGSTGELDSVAVTNNVISNNVVTSLQTAKATSVLAREPFYGPALPPPANFKAKNSSHSTTSSTYVNVDPDISLYVPGDGVTEYVFSYTCASANSSTSSNNTFMIAVNDDMSGLGGPGQAQEVLYKTDAANSAKTVTVQRQLTLPVGLHEISPYYKTSAGTLTVDEEFQNFVIHTRGTKKL